MNGESVVGVLFLPFVRRLYETSLPGHQQKNPVSQAVDQGFFFVDKRFEISNPDLIRDIVDIIETLEEFS